MKKNLKYIIGIILIVVIVAIIILISIFHLDSMKCSNNIKEETYNIQNNYVIYHKKDNVKKVVIERVVSSKNNTVIAFFLKNYEDEFKKYNKEYGGYHIITNETKKNKGIIKVEIDYKKVDMKKLLEKNSYLKDNIKNGQLNIDGAYKLFQLNKDSCK